MRILQTVFGAFHHFELAHELDRRRHLEAIYSTWPWRRLQREGLPREKVQTFPYYGIPDYLLHRSGLDVPKIHGWIGYQNALAFDRWTTRQLQNHYRAKKPLDALVGISGSSLQAGQLAQQHGAKFICDRGSTHQRFQEQIVSEEYRRWGVDHPVSDEHDTLREEAIYAAADAITVPSTAACRSFLAMGVPAHKLHVIPYGVRLESFQPTADPPQNTFDVLFAGAVSLRKGVPYLLQAFAALKQPRKRLRIVGSVQPELKPILATLPQQNVEFRGTLPQPELAALMSRSHVLVLPSIEEGLALVQAQALACGCPVICSEATGGEDLFTDGQEGYIVPVRDSTALTDRLQRLADDPTLQQQMRTAGIARVRTLGGWSTYGDRWESLLLQLTQYQEALHTQTVA